MAVGLLDRHRHTEIQTDRQTELLVIMALGLPDRHRHTQRYRQTDRQVELLMIVYMAVRTLTHREIQTERQNSDNHNATKQQHRWTISKKKCIKRKQNKSYNNTTGSNPKV